MLDEQSVLKRAEQASVQSMGNGAVVLMADTGQLYSGNDTAEAFLAHVNGSRSLGEIADLMQADYEVERAVLVEDLAALAGDMLTEGILKHAE